jgi:hypothetical protein
MAGNSETDRVQGKGVTSIKQRHQRKWGQLNAPVILGVVKIAIRINPKLEMHW